MIALIFSQQRQPPLKI